MSSKIIKGRRVVITGGGVISPAGLNQKDFWDNLQNGFLGLKKLAGEEYVDMPVKVAGQINDFEPLEYMERKEARRMDRYCQFAVAAARMALDDSRFSVAECGADRVGSIIGSGVGGLETMAEEYRKLYVGGGPARVSPLFIPMMIANMAAGMISMLHGAKGSSLCVTTACASGTHAIGEAFRAIKYGHLDACITGGTEAPITPIAIAGFNNMRALSQEQNPAGASIPFDKRRSGFVIGEGAGIIILEALETAQKRDANIICEIIGYGTTADAYHITSPDPAGEGATRSMLLAMQEGAVDAESVDYINAHGTSTPLNDKFETMAIHKALGEYATKVPVSSTKSMTGHLLGAAGAVETIATALVLRDGVVPPTIGLTEPDPECDLDYVPGQARSLPVKIALTNSLGFGGHNGTLCLKKWEE